MRIAYRTTFPAVLLFTLLVSSYAQLGPIKSVEPAKNGALVHAGSLTLELTAISPTAFRVRYSQTGKFPTHASFAVIGTSQDVKVERHDTRQQVILSTGQLSASVDRTTGILTFLDPSGEIISQDKPGFPVEFHGQNFRVYKSLPIDEHIFGLGDKAAPLDIRGQAFTNWNTDAVGWIYGSDPLYKSIPFFLTLRKGKSYGIFLDNTYRTSFDFGKQADDMYSFGSVGGELDYYFFYG